MKSLKRICLILASVCLMLSLGACARFAAIELPPLPTPRVLTPEEVYKTLPLDLIPPQETPAEIAMPEPTPMPTPEPTPVPTPEPTPEPEDPNTPHLYMDGASYPESMTQGGIAMLLGDVYTDKGVIVQVCGRIVDEEGNNVQRCVYYPYENSFSLAGTVNAELVFGLLEPGSYRYILSAIAENESYTKGEEILIDQPFDIYYP